MILCYSSLAFAKRDGNTLLKDCNAALNYADNKTQPDAIAEAATCVGYINGVLDTLTMWNAINEADFKIACFPDGVSPLQLIRVVVKYLNDHPEELHEAAIVLTFRAASTAFPCSKKSR